MSLLKQRNLFTSFQRDGSINCCRLRSLIACSGVVMGSNRMAKQKTQNYNFLTNTAKNHRLSKF